MTIITRWSYPYFCACQTLDSTRDWQVTQSWSVLRGIRAEETWSGCPLSGCEVDTSVTFAVPEEGTSRSAVWRLNVARQLTLNLHFNNVHKWNAFTAIQVTNLFACQDKFDFKSDMICGIHPNTFAPDPAWIVLHCISKHLTLSVLLFKIDPLWVRKHVNQLWIHSYLPIKHLLLPPFPAH